MPVARRKRHINYDFSTLPGKWTWRGDALATQKQLRNEW
jgi:hypothetical protein